MGAGGVCREIRTCTVMCIHRRGKFTEVAFLRHNTNWVAEAKGRQLGQGTRFLPAADT